MLDLEKEIIIIKKVVLIKAKETTEKEDTINLIAHFLI